MSKEGGSAGGRRDLTIDGRIWIVTGRVSVTYVGRATSAWRRDDFGASADDVWELDGDQRHRQLGADGGQLGRRTLAHRAADGQQLTCLVTTTYNGCERTTKYLVALSCRRYSCQSFYYVAASSRYRPSSDVAVALPLHIISHKIMSPFLNTGIVHFAPINDDDDDDDDEILAMFVLH